MPTCKNGHYSSSGSTFCIECGSPLIGTAGAARDVAPPAGGFKSTARISAPISSPDLGALPYGSPSAPRTYESAGHRSSTDVTSKSANPGAIVAIVLAAIVVVTIIGVAIFRSAQHSINTNSASYLAGYSVGYDTHRQLAGLGDYQSATCADNQAPYGDDVSLWVAGCNAGWADGQ